MNELSPAEDAKVAEFYAAPYPAEVLLAHLMSKTDHCGGVHDGDGCDCPPAGYPR